MKIKVGWKVKIPDVGPLAVCTKSGDKEIEIELDGERMMIPAYLCEVAEKRRVRNEYRTEL